MRERSKNAARTRREKENHEFAELARLLPHPSSSTANMDKATVVKLTTAYLKLRNIFPYGIGTPWGSQTQDSFLKDHAAFLVKSLEGFLIIIGPNLKTIYVSEGVSFYLGLSQTEMMGNSVMDYIHMGDHEELKNLLKHEEVVLSEDRMHQEIEVARCFSLRMKCTLTKRCAGLVRDSYKVILFRGYLKMAPASMPSRGTNDVGEVRYHAVGFVAAGNAIHPTTSLELKMHSNTFMCRTELDLKFLHVEDRIKDLTGYEPHHLRHKSLYKFVHVCDSFKLNEDHTQLLKKGQAVSSYYRFLTLNGGWIWIQSSFIMLLNSKSRHSFILAINHVLSEAECRGYLLEEEQAAKSSAFECDESGRPVYTPVVPESLKAPSKAKKKSMSENRIKNNCPDQYVSLSTYVQPSPAAVPLPNKFLPIKSTHVQPESIAALDSQLMTQPTNPEVSIGRDLLGIAQNNSSHASASFNNLRSCWYSSENMNSYPTSTVTSYTQTPVHSIPNEYCGTFPINTDSAYFGSMNDPSFNFSTCPNANLTSHSESSAIYSEYPLKTAKHSYAKHYKNGSFANEQQSYYVEPIGQDSLSSTQRNREYIRNFQVASPPGSSERNEPSSADLYNNDVSSCNEQQSYYTDPADQNIINYDCKYGGQIHNFHVVTSPASPQRHFISIHSNRNSPCGEQPYCLEQTHNLQLESPVDTGCNETYSDLDKTSSQRHFISRHSNRNSPCGEQSYCLEQTPNLQLDSPVGTGCNETHHDLNKTNLLSRSDSFPENSMDTLEPIPSFALPDLSSKAGIFSNVADEQLRSPQSVSSNLCSVEKTGDQTESMHFDSFSYSEKLICIEATVRPVQTSLEAEDNWSMNNFNSASPGVESIDVRNGNASSISKTHLDELSPVSANSLSSDPNTERAYFYLPSSSDYSNGYPEEPEKELDRPNYGISFNPVTNYRKDFLDFSAFENRTSSAPLYTTL